MNTYVALSMGGIGLLIYFISFLLDKNHHEDLGSLEVDILHADVGKKKTCLFFRDVNLPNGEQIQDLDVKIPTTIYQTMRKAKKSRVVLHFIRSRGFIKGEYESYA